MADEQESHEKGLPFDRKTDLIVDGTHFVDNSGTGHHLFVGPYFELRPVHSPNLTLYCPGVTWKKRIYDRGEYVASSKFCELCVPYKYSRADRHTYPDCLKAPKTAHSPGGAVVVPLGNHWHHAKVELTTAGNVSLSIVTRCVCVCAAEWWWVTTPEDQKLEPAAAPITTNNNALTCKGSRPLSCLQCHCAGVQTPRHVHTITRLWLVITQRAGVRTSSTGQPTAGCCVLTSRAMKAPCVACAAAATGAQRRSVAASAWGRTPTSKSVAATSQSSKPVELARTVTSADCQPTAVQQTEPSSPGCGSSTGRCWLVGSPF